MAKLPCPPQSRIYTLKDTGETMSYDQVREYLMSNPELWSGKAEVKVKKGDLVLKDGRVVTPTDIDGQTTFYHGSTKPRKGRLRANWAEGFGEAVYFGTDKRAIEEDYEDQYTTTAQLNLKKPLYYNNKKDWDAVVERAVELYSRKETPKLLDEYSKVVNGIREWYDEDAQAEYENKGYIEPRSAENWVKEEDASWINKAAQELGYDAIIAPHHSFGNEIAVFDENAIIYPEEIETEGKEAPIQKAPYVQEVIPPINEEQAAGEKEVEALKKGDKITTTHPMRLLKGIYGKRNVDGSIRSAHTGVNGIFSSITEKIARRYEGEEGVVVFEIPAGVTVETVEIPTRIDSKAVPISSLRPLETDAINASDAQVVKLITGDSRGRENQYIIKDPALRKIGYKPSEKKADPVLDFLERGKIKGVAGLNAAVWNKALDIIQAAYKAGKNVYEAIQEGIEYLKSKGEDIAKYQKRIDDVTNGLKEIAKKQGREIGEPVKEKPPVTPPAEEEKKEEGGKAVRELPEAPEGQVVRAVLGRFFQAAKSEKVANAILESGLFRTPGKIEEAFANGRKLVDELGWDGAYELFQNLSTGTETGIVLPEDSRMGIFNALTEDLQKRIDNPVSIEQQANDAILMAEVMAKGSELVSGGAKRMRIFQEILRKNTVPYQYERRIKEWKALFPDSEVTKELEEKLKAAEAKYKEINKRFMELVAKQKEWEESQAVSDIREDIESEKKAGKKAPFSVLKKLAERVRKLGVSRPGMFSAATPASLAWDAAVEAVAVTLDAGGSIEIAIKKGIQAIKDSKWYKGLSERNKKKAEAEFVNHYADISEEGGGMVEVVKGKIVIPHSLIRYYVSEGMTDINEIADTILEGLSEKYPDLTQREVRDAITGYARKVKKQTPDEINDAITTLKREGRLRSQLEDLQKGIVKEKDSKQKQVLSNLAKNLMGEIDRIHQEMFGHTPRQMSDAERLATYKKRTAEKIKELKRKIAEKDFSKKTKRPPFDFDKEANELEYEQYMLDEEWADMVRQEQKRQLGDWEKAGDILLAIWNVAKSVKVGIDFGFGGINAGLSTFNDAKETQKAFANAWKSMWSSMDYQKIDAKLKANPKYLDAKKAGVKFYSTKDYEEMKGDLVTISAIQRAWNEVGNALSFGLKKSIGSKKAEQFNKIWKQRNPIAGLERAGSSLLNTLNFGMYLRGAQIAAQRGYTYKTDPEVYKDIADLANTFSRRSSLKGLEKSRGWMKILNALLFSAQNWASIIKIASPYTFYWMGRKRAGTTNWRQLSPTQQLYGEIMLKAVGSYLGTLVLIKLATGWEDDDISDEERKRRGVTTVNLSDPRRADFLKIHGPTTTYDLFSGLAQEVILTSRIFSEMFFNMRGFVSSKTGIESHLGEGTTPSAGGLMLKQAEGKFSPNGRYVYLWLNSRPVKGQPSYIRKLNTGEEINMKEEFLDLYSNLTYETIKDEFKDNDPVPAAFLSLLGFYGYGVTREERIEEKAIGRQIQETFAPERKLMAYERAFKDYAKSGDEELAKKVFKDALQGKPQATKSIEMFKEMGADNIPEKYRFKSEDFDELIAFAKTGIPIKKTANMTDKKAARMQEINTLSKEALDRIKSDYAVQYDELQSAVRVLNLLNIKNDKGSLIDWQYKMNQIPWVKTYKKVMEVK